ncbi:hypothetical protein B0H16DRAFT_1577910 [Mycena metata]|uniref:Deuterolysin n=1 Tax=Mycena metata TaxID=1033252 RepID=A0AAD7I3V7_9AGAR|nr:hypothetical protein B0H16DRAFT_1577910 [Mycena metata]
MRPPITLILTLIPGIASAVSEPLISLVTRANDTVPDIPGLSPLTLRPQQPDFSSFDLTSALQPAYATQSTTIDLPAACSAYIGPDQECTTVMTAVSIVFEDCGDAFVVCRCADAEMTMDTVLDRLGRVPVGLRRYAGTIVVAASPTGPYAYTLTTGDTHFFGNCAMDIWVHEMTHTFDFALPTRQSSAPGWNTALATDTCVPDTYSQNNEVEDFAQVGVMMIYTILYGGNLPPGFTSDCMSSQLAFMYGLALYDPGPLFGNNCDIIDGGPPARHSIPPATLDPSRSFQPLSPVVGAGAAVTSGNSAALSHLNTPAFLLTIGVWALLS